MNLIEDLRKRGLIYHITNEPELTDFINEKRTFYVGFDLTAKSLHIGNLVMIMILRKILSYGHNVIILLGDATTRIGDPSGKNEIRKMLSLEEIEGNKKNILYCINKFIDINSENVRVAQNYNWFKDINYIDLLREVGKDFTINKMIQMDFVKSRLDKNNPMTFLEFNYVIMQSYDFYYLYSKYNCSIQFGGSDQWGNIINGMNLIKHKDHSADAFCFTAPLLTKSDGQKMGKSLNGAVWLNEEMLSPFEYFQYWRNIDDKDLIKIAKIFTDLSFEEIEKMENLSNHIEINKAKELVAFEITKMCHGVENANAALKWSVELFLNNAETFEAVKINQSSISVVELITFADNLISKSEARRLINSGAIKIDNVKITEDFIIQKSESFIFEIGKKKKFKFLLAK
jgi:tyrosyl-tRNA synthetase